MARDYKNAGRTRNAKPGPLRAALPFATGLSLGLFAALLLYLYGPQHAPAPAADEAPARSAPPATRTPEAVEPDEPETARPEPRFDFYTILPEMEVKVPDWQLPGGGKERSRGIEPGAYVIQVGSFQRFEEADRVKARLALQGIVADIQRVVIDGRDVWYRVRLGPFTDGAELDAMRSRLVELGMDFMVLRIKSEG